MLARKSPFYYEWKFLLEEGFPVGAPQEFGGLGAPFALIPHEKTHRYLTYLNSLGPGDLAQGVHLSINPPVERLPDVFRERVERYFAEINLTLSADREAILSGKRPRTKQEMKARQGPFPIAVRGDSRQLLVRNQQGLRGLDRVTPMQFQSLQDNHFLVKQSWGGIQHGYWFRKGSPKESVPSLRRAMRVFSKRVGEHAPLPSKARYTFSEVQGKKAWSIAPVVIHRDKSVYGLGPLATGRPALPDEPGMQPWLR
jgi:hypothetical protein